MPTIPSIVSDLLHLPWAASQQHDTHETETLNERVPTAAQTLSPGHMRPPLPVEREEDLRQGFSRRAELVANVRRPIGSAAGKGANGRSADERRLLGDYRAPPDAVAIKVPGNDEPSYPPARNHWEAGASRDRYDQGYEGRDNGGDRKASHRSNYSSTNQGKRRINRQIQSTRPAGKHTRFSSSPPARSAKRQRVSSPTEARQETAVELVDLVDEDDDMLMKPANSPRVERTTKTASREPRSPARSRLTTLDATASPLPFSRQIPTSTQPISAYEKLNGRRPPHDNNTTRQQISRGSPEVVVSSTQQPRRNGRSMSPPETSVSSRILNAHGNKRTPHALERLERELPESSPDQLQNEGTTESRYFADDSSPTQTGDKRRIWSGQPQPGSKKPKVLDSEFSRLIQSTKSQSAPQSKRSEAQKRVQQQDDDVDTSLDELQQTGTTVESTVTRLAGAGTKRKVITHAASPSEPTIGEGVANTACADATPRDPVRRAASPTAVQMSAKKVKRRETMPAPLPVAFLQIYGEDRMVDDIDISSDPVDSTLKVYGRDKDHLYTIAPKRVHKIVYSKQQDDQGPIIQVVGLGKDGCFVGFDTNRQLNDFFAVWNQIAKDMVPIEETGTRMLKILNRKAAESHVLASRKTEERALNDMEMDLLQQKQKRRVEMAPELERPNNQSTSAERRARLLTSRLQAAKQTDPEGTSGQSTLGRREQTLRHPSDLINTASNLAQRATTRLSSTRQKVRSKSPTPPRSPGMTDAQFQESLGPPWKDPVVYPPTGRNRATVNFSDLYRLRDDEFLNDAIIDFYIGYAAQKAQLPPNRVYFFNTFFYSQLATPAGRGQRIDYTKVEKWTAKVDIFSYDYVVVPVNEDMHWYLAVICNLPNMKRTINVGEVDEDTSKVGDEALEAKTASPEPKPEARTDKPVDVSNDLEEVPRVDGSANENNPEEEPALTSSYARMNLGDIGPSVDAQRAPQGSQVAQPPEGASAQERQVTPSASTASGQRNSITQSLARASSQVMVSPSATKNRRKPGPPPKRYDTQKPVIIIMDSLGVTHAKTAKNLKLYLMEEGLSKRGLSINPDEIPSMYAKDIPTQTNWSDCGLYLLAYVSKLVHDPTGFITKILTRDMDVKADWPDMNARRMRVDIIDMLRMIHDEQAATKRQQKLVRKQQQAAAALQHDEDGGKAKCPANGSKSPEQDAVLEAKATDDSAAMPPPALPASQSTHSLKPSASNLSLVELDGATMEPILPPSKRARDSLDLTEASDVEDLTVDSSNVMDALDNAISADTEEKAVNQKRPPQMLPPSPYGSFLDASFAMSGLPILPDDVEEVEEVRPPTRGKECD